MQVSSLTFILLIKDYFDNPASNQKRGCRKYPKQKDEDESKSFLQLQQMNLSFTNKNPQTNSLFKHFYRRRNVSTNLKHIYHQQLEFHVMKIANTAVEMF